MFISYSSEAEVVLTRSNGGNGEDTVANKLAVFLKHCYPQRGQRGEDHLGGGERVG